MQITNQMKYMGEAQKGPEHRRFCPWSPGAPASQHVDVFTSPETLPTLGFRGLWRFHHGGAID